MADGEKVARGEEHGRGGRGYIVSTGLGMADKFRESIASKQCFSITSPCYSRTELRGKCQARSAAGRGWYSTGGYLKPADSGALATWVGRRARSLRAGNV